MIKKKNRYDINHALPTLQMHFFLPWESIDLSTNYENRFSLVTLPYRCPTTHQI